MNLVREGTFNITTFWLGLRVGKVLQSMSCIIKLGRLTHPFARKFSSTRRININLLT